MSSNKKNFLKKPENAIQMRADEIPGVVKHYADKYKIKVIINGETHYGQTILKVHDEIAEKFKEEFKNENSKYSRYIQKFWRPFNFYQGIGEFDITQKLSAFMAQYNELEQLIINYLNLGNVKQDLSLKDLNELNAIIASSPFKELFDSQIQKLIKTYQSNECLTEAEAKKEIESIQASLNEGEYVGYVYTNNNRVMADHFEVLIISKSKIIRPVSWKIRADKMIDFKGANYADSDVKEFVSSVKSDGTVTRNYTPYPQASEIECGPLGMLYLKELLKNNAGELCEASLLIPYYSNNTLKNLFFPSPLVLRYSQSGGYNQVIKSMLMSDSETPITVTYKAETHTVTPLFAILLKTKKTAIEKNDKVMIAQCDELLKKLPDFRQKWISGYEKSAQMRDLMQGATNQYLSYKSIRFYKIAKPTGESNEASHHLISDIQQNVDVKPKINMPQKSPRLAEFAAIHKELDGLEEYAFTLENEDERTMAAKEFMAFKKSIRRFENTKDIMPLQHVIDNLQKKNLSGASADLKKFYQQIKTQTNDAMLIANQILGDSNPNPAPSGDESSEESGKSPGSR